MQNLVVALRPLVLNKELQFFLPDLRLDVATYLDTAKAHPQLSCLVSSASGVSILRVIRAVLLVNSFSFVVSSYDGHPGFQIKNITKFCPQSS